MTEQPCPFCEIVAGLAPAEIVEEWPEALAIVPLNPVVEGHVLVLPREHVRDFVDHPAVSAATMRCAAELVAGLGSYNLITSKGRAATQSVFHLHLHLVPRAVDDGLALPWYSGRDGKQVHS
ncbi:HIT domain-containing protein [Streptomyces sp. NPDC000351]|uniref:HIT family protein n=1 Tax=Streptomyces sp. NPDC000351 TaxID=3154250 RepID=UPI00331EB064